MHEIRSGSTTAAAHAHTGRGSHGNGLRIHVLLFGLMSLAMLVAAVTAIAAASTGT
jgi:hypothetical protein